jgi:hypothetical protein
VEALIHMNYDGPELSFGMLVSAIASWPKIEPIAPQAAFFVCVQHWSLV